MQKKKLSVLVIEPNVQRRQALLESLKDEGIRILGTGADIAEAMIYANAKNPNPGILLINIDPCWEIGVQEWVMIKAAVPAARIIAWFKTFNRSCVETALAVGVAGLFQEHDHYPGIMDLIWRVADGAEEIDEEILERLRSSFRQSQDADVFRFRGFHMDLNTFETTLHGASLKLSPLEFKLLMYFLRNCNREVSGEELLEKVWQMPVEKGGALAQVRNSIKRLRVKIESPDRPLKYINTVWGKGYVFLDPPEWVPHKK